MKEPKRGAIVTLMALCLSLLFPVIQFTVIELGRIHVIKEQLKFDLSASAVSAVTCVDWDMTYTGGFMLELGYCEDVIYRCLLNNIDPERKGYATGLQYMGMIDGICRYRGTIGGVSFYVEIYNGTNEVLLGGDRIPDEITGNQMLAVHADKPAVFIAARYSHKPSLMQAVTNVRSVSIVQYSSAELRAAAYELN